MSHSIRYAYMIRKLLSPCITTCIAVTLLFNGLFDVSHADTLPNISYYTATGPVTSMDSHGSILWCGTRFGLVRWDTAGMTYDILHTPDGLPHADIEDLDVASDGTLWIVTAENGVARYDGSSWQSYSTDDGLPYLNGLSIHVADDGAVYAGLFRPGFYYYGGGLSRFDGDSWRWQRYSPNRDDGVNFIRDIATDTNGTVWVACGGRDGFGEGPLASVVDKTWTLYDINATHVMVDAGGILWVYGGTGISRLIDDSFESVILPEGFEYSDVVALGAQAEGGILILTQYGGLLGITEAGIVNILADDGDESLFTAMTVDQSGIVWAGLSNGGIARFSDGGWNMFPLDQSPVDGIVYALSYDQDGTLWAVADNGLFSFINWDWVQIVSGEKVPDYGNDPDFSLFFDSNNILWMVGYYDGKKDIRYLDNGELVSDPAIDIYGGVLRAAPDIHSGLWLRFREKRNVYQYQNGILTEIPSPDSSYKSFLPLAVDCEGGVWCTTYTSHNQYFARYINGVWEPHQEVYISAEEESELTGLDFGPDGSVWVSVTDNHGTTHWPSYSSRILCKPVDADVFSVVYSIDTGSVLENVDNEGRLWLSRYGFQDDDYYGRHYYGIVYYDGGTPFEMREPQGLPDDRVRDVVVDSGNGIWIATDKGIVRYTDDTTHVTEQNTIPSSFEIITAYPNPFNPSTTIGFTLPQTGMTTAAVYSITGQEVRTLLSGQLDAGNHRVIWDGLDGEGNSVASGVYCVRISTRGYYAVARITLIR